MPPVTRIAPTPSGYLHAGNAWSFAVTWLAARSRGGRIHLRIDDLDAARCREEYLEDIFASLEWLGLDYDQGPRDPAEFRARFSQRLRVGAYRAALDRLLAMQASEGPLVYACVCSREQVKRAAAAAGTAGLYPGTCRGLSLGRNGPGTLLRLRCEAGDHVGIEDLAAGPLSLDPCKDMGDFVLLQRNGDTAYQLASLIDDEAIGVDLVVRGLDLLPSTGAQALLARRLGLEKFPRAAFLHHGLIMGEGGSKLSKSSGDPSLATLRARLGSPEALYRFFAASLGMDPAGKKSAADLLQGFSPARVPRAPLRWEDFLRGIGN